MDYIEYMQESRRQLGIHIKRLRRYHNLTQLQFSKMVGLHRTYISRIECGDTNASFEALVVIANGLGVSPSELLMGIAIPKGHARIEHVALPHIDSPHALSAGDSRASDAPFEA